MTSLWINDFTACDCSIPITVHCISFVLGCPFTKIFLELSMVCLDFTSLNNVKSSINLSPNPDQLSRMGIAVPVGYELNPAVGWQPQRPPNGKRMFLPLPWICTTLILVLESWLFTNSDNKLWIQRSWALSYLSPSSAHILPTILQPSLSLKRLLPREPTLARH